MEENYSDAYPRINSAGGMGKKWAKFRSDVEFFSNAEDKVGNARRRSDPFCGNALPIT